MLSKSAYKHKLSYINAYGKKKYKQVLLKFRIDEDKQILDKLETVDSKNEYIKKLILKDIATTKK